MKYQSLKRLAKAKTNYKVLMSGRSTGKSTAMADYLIDRFEKNGYKFIRMVRNSTYTIDADSYFDRFSIGGEFYNKNPPKRGDRLITYECYYDSGKRIIGNPYTYYYNGVEFGELKVLSLSSKYKGGVYDDMYKTFVFDEYIELSMLNYIDNEYSAFMSILSTICRNRSDVEVWLLGNNINDDSKYNPYHMAWGIDINRDNLKPGDFKIYYSNIFKNPAKIAFEYGLMAYENENEIPLLQRVPGNDVATSGKFAAQYDIFDQSVDYPQNLDFLRNSVNNFYIKADNGIYYYFIINTSLQCFDLVKCNTNISEIGNGGDEKRYNILIKYQSIFIKQYGADYYYNELKNSVPYQIAIPLYDNHTIYGQNLEIFVTSARKKYIGYSVRYCDGNIKYLWIVTLKNRTLL